MKGNQQESLYWHSRRFDQGRKRKYYDLCRSVTELLSTCLCFIKKARAIKLMLGALFSECCHSNTICREKRSVSNDIQQRK
jgi:hypothetical protein